MTKIKIEQLNDFILKETAPKPIRMKAKHLRALVEAYSGDSMDMLYDAVDNIRFSYARLPDRHRSDEALAREFSRAVMNLGQLEKAIMRRLGE